MKNKLILLGIAAALAVAWAGIHYRIRIVIVLVLVGLAIFSFTAGVRMILTRHAAIPTSDDISAHHEFHTGLSAQFWGVLFVIFSIPLGVFGVMYWRFGDNPPTEIIERMVHSPALALVK